MKQKIHNRINIFKHNYLDSSRKNYCCQRNSPVLSRHGGTKRGYSETLNFNLRIFTTERLKKTTQF